MTSTRTVSATLLMIFATLAAAQATAPEAAPGLPLRSSRLPMALDHFDGKLELVPVHHSTIELNRHRGANAAGELAGSFFYKPKLTMELAGTHARTALHDTTPSFFVQILEDPDGKGDSADAQTHQFGLVRATLVNDRRVFAVMRISGITGKGKRKDGVIETRTEHLDDGWLKLTPTAPLDPGEYALSELPRDESVFETIVYDFTLDPQAPNAADAVLPKP